MAIPKDLGISVAPKDMKFKYICKYCQKSGLAWKVIDHKWTLFEDHSTHHTCDEKKDKLSSQVSNLTKKKTPVKKSGFQEHMENILIKGEKLTTQDQVIPPPKPVNMGPDGMPLAGMNFAKGTGKGPTTTNPIDGLDELPYKDEPKKTNPKSSKSKVKLSLAKELYQPVYGSSQSSTYYVVALYTGLKFAARVTGGGNSRIVSIRVEGSEYTKLKGISGLQKFKDNGKYGSIHVNVETVYEAKMLICGLIGGLDLEALSPIPDLTNIAK